MYKYTIAKVGMALQQKIGSLEDLVRETMNPIKKYRLRAHIHGLYMARREVEIIAAKMKAELRWPGSVTYVPRGEIWVRQRGMARVQATATPDVPISHIKKTAVLSAIEEDLREGLDISIRT